MLKQKWHDEALTLSLGGLSGREIAKIIGRSKSQINDFLRWHKSQTIKPTQTNKKVLLFDIETSPILGYVWSRWQQNVSSSQIEQESFILSFAAKWLDGDEIFSYILTPEEIQNEDDSFLLEQLIPLLEESSVVVGHNAARFDIPIVKARALVHGFPPLLPFRTTDTLQIAKKEFRFSSNKLDDLCRFLNLDVKMEHSGFSLWKGVLHCDETSRQTMLEYNIQDVVILEQLYKKLISWDSRAVNQTLVHPLGTLQCIKCGSDDIEMVEGKFAFTNLSKFGVYRCNVCGGISRSRTRLPIGNTLANVV